MPQGTQSNRNRLIELAGEDFDRLRPHLHDVTFEYRMPLCEAERPLQHVFFPTSGVASLVITMMNGLAAEVGTIGNEGLVGLPIVLGDKLSATTVYIQVPGQGLRLDAQIFAEELNRNTRLRTIMLHYAHAFFNQIAQSAACTHFHDVDQRCCRWLLMTHDRVQSQQFLLTQEFLAMMLGVQRPSVSIAARRLKDLGLIDYQRGLVTVLDRRGLEKHSCECYMASKKEFDRLLGPPLGLSA